MLVVVLEQEVYLKWRRGSFIETQFLFDAVNYITTHLSQKGDIIINASVYFWTLHFFLFFYYIPFYLRWIKKVLQLVKPFRTTILLCIIMLSDRAQRYIFYKLYMDSLHISTTLFCLSKKLRVLYFQHTRNHFLNYLS